MDERQKNISLAQQLIDKLAQIERHLHCLRQQGRQSPKEWLTVAQTAKVLQISTDTVQRLIYSRKLKAAVVDTDRIQGNRHRYRIHRDWIREFMAGTINTQTLTPLAQKPTRSHRRKGCIDYIK